MHLSDECCCPSVGKHSGCKLSASVHEKTLNPGGRYLSNFFPLRQARCSGILVGRKGVTQHEKDHCNHSSPCSHFSLCLCRVPETAAGTETSRTVVHDLNDDGYCACGNAREEIGDVKAEIKGPSVDPEGLFIFRLSTGWSHKSRDLSTPAFLSNDRV